MKICEDTVERVDVRLGNGKSEAGSIERPQGPRREKGIRFVLVTSAVGI